MRYFAALAGCMISVHIGNGDEDRTVVWCIILILGLTCPPLGWSALTAQAIVIIAVAITTSMSRLYNLTKHNCQVPVATNGT